MHRSASRTRLSQINSSSRISTKAMLRMSLAKSSTKRRSHHLKDSLFHTMMTARIRRKIILMKALKTSLLHLRALSIRETSIRSQYNWTISSFKCQLMNSTMWLFHQYLILIFLSIPLAVAMEASDKSVTIISSQGAHP
jgi:hypothetical protein